MTGPGYDETTAPVPAEDSGMPEFSVAMASTTVDDTSYSKIEHDDNDDDNDDELTTRTTQTESDNTQPSLPIDGIKMMDEGFQPGAYDVVVGMRKKSTTHSGYVRFCCYLFISMLFLNFVLNVCSYVHLTNAIILQKPPFIASRQGLSRGV